MTYAVFVIDYLVRLMLAKPRAAWFRGHLLDLAIVVIPMLRALRLLRVLTAMTFGKQTAGTVLRSRIAIYGAGASLLVIYLCALAVLDVERGAPGANIETFGDAMWWAFVTVATVGYGDFYPVTALGRMWAVGLMAGGIAIVGTVTATVSSWVIEKAALGRDDDEPATRGQMRGLVQQVTEMHQELAAPAERRRRNDSQARRGITRRRSPIQRAHPRVDLARDRRRRVHRRRVHRHHRLPLPVGAHRRARTRSASSRRSPRRSSRSSPSRAGGCCTAASVRASSTSSTSSPSPSPTPSSRC